MRMRFALVAVALVAACGGDGDGDGTEVALEPVVAIDPCGVLDPDTARELVGADVAEADAEETEAEIGSALARAVGCSYHLTGAGTDDGRAIAATLVLGASDEEPEVAVEQRLDELAADPEAADPGAVEPVDLDGADAAATSVTQTSVRVVYVVEQVVASVEVSPVEAIDDGKVADVVAFAASSVPTVKEAKQEQDAAIDAGTDGTDGTDGDSVQVGEIEGLWTGDWGTMAIEEDGGEVRAAYTHDQGRITGTFADGVFTGRWTELPTREGPNDAGGVEFRFAKSEDGTIALDGRWDYDGDPERLTHEDWDLTLSEDTIPPELLEAFDDEASFDEP